MIESAGAAAVPDRYGALRFFSSIYTAGNNFVSCICNIGDINATKSVLERKR